jgi:hypothetical protein
MQGCFKSSLSGLREARNALRRPQVQVSGNPHVMPSFGCPPSVIHPPQ